MSIGVVALVLAAIGQGGADAPPPVVHEQRLDDVGTVAITTSSGSDSNTAQIVVSHRGLPPGSFAEITALSSGRTIIALVERQSAPAAGMIGSLSAGAARALDLEAEAAPAVRIRPAAPSPAEQAAVRSGTVVRRLDAPSALLTGLRRRLPPLGTLERSKSTTPAPLASLPVKPAPRPTPQPAPVKATRPAKPAAPAPTAARGRWFVQVATLSDAVRAAALAKTVDGVVRSAGRLYRVQAGPFATRAAAETARASVARRGFGDARIIAQD